MQTRAHHNPPIPKRPIAAFPKIPLPLTTYAAKHNPASIGYRSRDFRYLGTIGLFDEISAPLRPGTNELTFAVSESFGGWGILAQILDTEGVTIQR